jgi:hypothetical protein
MCGFVAAINSGGGITVQATNPYLMGRLNIGDVIPMKDIEPYIY